MEEEAANATGQAARLCETPPEDVSARSLEVLSCCAAGTAIKLLQQLLSAMQGSHQAAGGGEPTKSYYALGNQMPSAPRSRQAAPPPAHHRRGLYSACARVREQVQRCTYATAHHSVLIAYVAALGDAAAIVSHVGDQERDITIQVDSAHRVGGV